MGAMDEGLYLTRVKRASLGDWRLGNVMIYEHRDDPWVYGPIGEGIQGRFVNWFGLAVGDADIAFTLILPIVLTLIAFRLFMSMTGSVRLSLLGALTIMLGQYLLSKDTPLLHGRLVNPELPLPLQFVRPISPQFYFLPFLLLLWSAYRMFEGSGRRWAWAAGTALAAQLYTNFFLTSFSVTALGLLMLLALIERRMRVVVTFAVAGGIAVAGSLPYLHNLWLTLSHPNYQESFARLGGYATRAPIIPVVHAAVAVAFVVGCWTARRERWYQFVVALLATGFVCLNQQLITGRTVQPFHWESQTNKVALEIALVLGAWWITRAVSWRTGTIAAGGACAVGIALLLAHGWVLQDQYLRSKRDEFVTLQRLGPALNWLADHTARTDVVLVNPLHVDWADYVTTVAGNYTYISEPFFHASFLSRDEIERRYLGGLRLFGATPEQVREFGRWYNGAHFLGMAGVPTQVPTADLGVVARYLDGLQARYENHPEGSVWAGVSDFKLDYVLMRADEKTRLVQHVSSSQIHQVYDDGLFSIWRVAQGRR